MDTLPRMDYGQLHATHFGKKLTAALRNRTVLAKPVYTTQSQNERCCGDMSHLGIKKSRHRDSTRIARVRAEHPSQLDYSGNALNILGLLTRLLRCV